MGDVFPELPERAQHTTLVIKAEEERFNEVLDRGIEMFEKVASEMQKRNQRVIPGEEAFRLYDTYGFPLDLTQLMAREKELEVDQMGFNRELENQRERARKSGKFSASSSDSWESITPGSDSEFVGHEKISEKASIRKVRKEGKELTLLLDRTPFYGEAGGQIGDTGEIQGEDFHIQIEDTQIQGDQILHIGHFTKGNSIQNPTIQARVDREKRLSTARNHTATHLLHKVLKEVLGEHVNQAGSLVEPNRLRFDFTHFEAVSPDQLNEIERRVNQHIREDMPVEKYITSMEEAKKQGVVALFGEKYGDQVRVVKINDYSKELCGGTHLDRTGEIGYFRIINEESIAAGVRRIEALTGVAADDLLREENEILKRLEERLHIRRNEIEGRIAALLEERKELEKRIKQAQKASAMIDLESMLKEAGETAGVRYITRRVQIDNMDEFRAIGDRIRDRLKSGVGVLATVADQKIVFLCAVTDDLIKAGKLKAGDIVKQVAQIAGGSGGGRPHLALAGAKDINKLDEALNAVPKIIRTLVKGK
jgi:alanyl-tRNA synthetase